MSEVTIVPGSKEHDAAMIALADKNSTIMISDSAGNRNAVPKEEPAVAPAAAPAAAAEGETLILGKFKTQADLEAAYQELQRKQSQPKPAAAAAAKPAAAAQVDHKAAVDAAITKVIAAQTKLASAADDAAKTAAQAELTAANAEAVAANTAALAPPVQEETPAADAGLTSAMELAAKSFNDTGDISEEAFVALEAQGITREYATQYATGLKAQAELVEVKTYAEVGGKEQYAVIKQWADANLSAEQKQAFNLAMNSNLETFLGSVRNMKALYVAANGKAPNNRIEGEGGNGPVPVMFRSEAEVTKAMSDPRYATDPAYRKDVEQKMLASMNAGVQVLR